MSAPVLVPQASEPCATLTPPARPALDACPDSLDMAPGSCPRINQARVLDYAARLDTWRDYVVAACAIKS